MVHDGSPVFQAGRHRRDTISLGNPVEIDVESRSLASVDDCPLSSSLPASDEGYFSPRIRGHRVLTEEMMAQQEEKKSKLLKVVLTGGPCGGKTTGQERLATFFENIGWKVYTIPECATVLLGGGVKFSELTAEQAYEFQKDLLLTLLRIEDVFIHQAMLEHKKNVLLICDRGAMDPSAYVDADSWQKMLKELGLEQFNLRDNRYDQIVHLVTAADGAARHYTLSNNKTRKEGIQQAMELDRITRNAWLGHPYVEIIDNTETNCFEDKIRRLIEVIADRAGVEVHDRLKINSKKRKWLVSNVDIFEFPSQCEMFEVKHDYLLTEKKDNQVRVRSRCQNGRTTYTLTTRTVEKGTTKKGEVKDEIIETRKQLQLRDYQAYYRMKDKTRSTIHKTRKCFTYGKQYFNLDCYEEPLPPGCKDRQLMILETYTTRPAFDPLPTLPPFLTVEKEVTGDDEYSMYTLSFLSKNESKVNGASPNETSDKSCRSPPNAEND